MKKHIIIISLGILISALHYLTPIHQHHLHAVFQRLYYIPIMLAAYYFNLKFTIVYAVLFGLLYAPHIFFQWSFDAAHSFTQYVEISMFLVIASILGILFEIRHQQQNQIIHQQEELAKEKKLSLLGKLAAGLAHEIRNPLGGLLGSAEILKESLGEEHPKAEFVQIIEKELKRVNSKLNEFLDFARPRQPGQKHHALLSGQVLESGIDIGIGWKDNFRHGLILVICNWVITQLQITNYLITSYSGMGTPKTSRRLRLKVSIISAAVFWADSPISKLG